MPELDFEVAGADVERYTDSGATGDACRMQTQCLVRGGSATRLDDGEPPFTEVEALEVGGEQHLTWQEAVEREVEASVPAIGRCWQRPIAASSISAVAAS